MLQINYALISLRSGSAVVIDEAFLFGFRQPVTVSGEMELKH